MAETTTDVRNCGPSAQALTLHHDAVGPTAQGADSVGAPMLCDRYVKGCRQPEV